VQRLCLASAQQGSQLNADKFPKLDSQQVGNNMVSITAHTTAGRHESLSSIYPSSPPGHAELRRTAASAAARVAASRPSHAVSAAARAAPRQSCVVMARSSRGCRARSSVAASRCGVHDMGAPAPGDTPSGGVPVPPVSYDEPCRYAEPAAPAMPSYGYGPGDAHVT